MGRKEIDTYLRIALAGSAFLAACKPQSPGRVEKTAPATATFSPGLSADLLTRVYGTFVPETKTPEPSATWTPAPTETEIAASETEAPTATETMTAVPTEVISILGSKESITGQILELQIESPLFKYGNKVMLVYYFATTDAERNALEDATAPGKGTAATYVMADGSVMIVEHSGYSHYKPSEAEAIRRYVQGGDVNVANYTDAQVQEKMDQMKGSDVTLVENGVAKAYSFFYMQKIAYDQADLFRQDASKSLQVALQLDREANNGVSVLDNIPGQVIAINFCGWARQDQVGNLRSPEDQWEYDSFVIYLVPKVQ